MTQLTYAIGDLHGRYDVLEACLEKINQHRTGRSATIVFLGDYIDRGPDSKLVVERLMAGPTDDTEWKIISGNHEEMAIMAHMNPDAYMKWWKANGGSQTLDSFGEKIPDDVLVWFGNLPDHYQDDHRLFVHAGVKEGTLEEQTHEVRLWVRYARETETPCERYVVHGHTPYMDGPVVLETRCNLDTKAYLSGRAAIAVFNNWVSGPPTEMLNVVVGYALST